MFIEAMRLIKVKAQFEPAFKEQLAKSPPQFLAAYYAELLPLVLRKLLF
jgi:hypothetical protein